MTAGDKNDGDTEGYLQNISALPSVFETIQSQGLIAKKRFGQNFLTDPNLLSKIAKAAGPLQGFHVIEIGPGPGGLTRALLKEGAASVTALELDLECINLLEPLKAAADGRLNILHQDALKTDFKSLLGGRPTKIVANLPYNIATELIARWLEAKLDVASYTVMVQKEVALRLTASKKDEHYGRLSLLAQFFTTSKRLFDVPPRAFIPAPKVMSSILSLTPHNDYDANLWPNLSKIIASAFNQRRKMLRSSLKSVANSLQLEVAFEQAKCDGSMRAEDLSLDEFMRLSSAMK